jgi:hypothetical protein
MIQAPVFLAFQAVPGLIFKPDKKDLLYLCEIMCPEGRILPGCGTGSDDDSFSTATNFFAPLPRDPDGACGVRKLTGQTRVPYNRGMRVRGSPHRLLNGDYATVLFQPAAD